MTKLNFQTILMCLRLVLLFLANHVYIILQDGLFSHLGAIEPGKLGNNRLFIFGSRIFLVFGRKIYPNTLNVT